MTRNPDLPTRVCRYCGASFLAVRFAQRYCSTTHKAKWEHRAMMRGRQVYSALYQWRLTRGQGEGKGLLNEVSVIVDSWIKKDREPCK